jgi:hypothetical protein
MWCPNDFRRMHSVMKRKSDLDDQMYDKELVDKINADKQYLYTGKWVVA